MSGSRVTLLSSTSLNIGSGFRFWNLGRALISLGFEVTIISPASKVQDLPEIDTVLRRGLSLKFLRVPPSGLSIREQLAHSWANMITSLNVDSDFVHISAIARPPMATITLLEKMISHRRLFIDWDDLFGTSWEGYGLKALLGNKVASILQSHVTPYGERISVASHFLLDRARRLGIEESRLYFLFAPCDTKSIPILEKSKCRRELKLPEGFIIVVVGYPLPDGTNAGSFIRLLEGFDKLCSEYEDPFLVMVGRQNIPAEATQLFSKLSERILQLGTVRYEAIPKVLGSADVLYLLMEDSPLDNSRFPQRFSDYLCAGRPIVCPAVGEIKNIMTKNPCGLTVHSSEEILCAFRFLHESNSALISFGRQCRRLAEEEYSLSTWSNLVNQMYSETG